eukprot:757743-Hanusia_phi.AAC.3
MPLNALSSAAAQQSWPAGTRREGRGRCGPIRAQGDRESEEQVEPHKNARSCSLTELSRRKMQARKRMRWITRRRDLKNVHVTRGGEEGSGQGEEDRERGRGTRRAEEEKWWGSSPPKGRSRKMREEEENRKDKGREGSREGGRKEQAEEDPPSHQEEDGRGRHGRGTWRGREETRWWKI